MAVDGVMSSIELCKLIVKISKSLYEAATNVETNFAKKRGELGKQMNDLSLIVEQVKTALERQPQKHYTGLENILEDTKGFFLRVKTFFDKLDRLKGDNGARYILKRVSNYFDIKDQFKDCNRIVPNLHSRLNRFLAAGIFEVVVDIRQESDNEQKDFESLVTRVEKTDEVTTALYRKDSFERKRFAHGDDLSIKPDEISNESFVCTGSYGNYSTAYLDKEKVMVLRMWDDAGDVMKDGFAREKRNLMFFSSGSIVRVIGYCDEQAVKFLVLEYMEQGKLSDVLYNPGKTLSVETKLRLAKTAASALYRLHQILVHTSLRTEMFLVDEQYTAKLSGLQSAKTFSSARRFVPKKPIVDVDRYIAPERYQPIQPTKSADIYAFGIVLWEIFTQTKPFATLEKEIGKTPTIKDIKKFLLDDHREEYLVGDQNDPVMAEVSKIIRRCRAIDPQQRPDSGGVFDELNKMYEELTENSKMINNEAL